MATSSGGVFVEIIVRDKTKQGTDSAKNNFEGFSKSVGKSLSGITAAFAALGAASLLTQSIRQFGEFDKKIRGIGTLLENVTGAQLKQISKEVQTFAIQFGQSLDKVAEARFFVISSGFKDIADSAIIMQTSAKLAVAGFAEISDTTKVLVQVLNAYGKGAEEAARVSDILFETVNLGVTTVQELSTGLGRVIAVAPQIGVSFEQLSGALATLTLIGQSTDEAVTSLTGVMNALLKPSTQMAAVFKEIGFVSAEAAINSLGFAGALNKITAGKTDEQLAAMFGDLRAIRGILPLAGTAAELFGRVTEGVANSAKSAEKAYEQMALSAGVKLERALQLGQVALVQFGAALEPLIDFILDTSGAFEDIPRTVEKLDEATNDLKAFINSAIDDFRALEKIINDVRFAFGKRGLFQVLIDDINEFQISLIRLNTFVIDFFDDFIPDGFLSDKIKSEKEKGIEEINRLSSVLFKNKVLLKDSEDFFNQIEKIRKEGLKGSKEVVDELIKSTQIDTKVRNELDKFFETVEKTTAAIIKFNLVITSTPLEQFQLITSEIEKLNRGMVALELQAQKELITDKQVSDETINKLKTARQELEALKKILTEIPMVTTIEQLFKPAEPLAPREFPGDSVIGKVPEEIKEGAEEIKDGTDIILTGFQQFSLEANEAFKDMFTQETANAIVGIFDVLFGRVESKFEEIVKGVLQTFASALAQIASQKLATKLLDVLPGPAGLILGGLGAIFGGLFQKGGIIPRFQTGGIVGDQFQLNRSIGTDRVPILATPGEAVIPQQSVVNNQNTIQRLINSPAPIQSQPQPMVSHNNVVNVAFSGFNEDTALRIMSSPEFRHAFARLVNNGDLRLETVRGTNIVAIK